MDMTGWILVKQVGNTLANLNGNVRSLNPSHNEPPFSPYKWEERPPGTTGGYEQATVNGCTVCYNPSGQQAVVFPFIQTVPHSNGLSAMMENPLKVDTIPLAEYE